MSFYDIALPYAQMGIPVFPLKPKDKLPPSWMAGFPRLATTDLEQLKRWDEKLPDANCALLGRNEKVGDLFFLEFDIADGLLEAADELGEELPVTRVHTSGRGFEHWLFRHTKESLGLGNRSANRDGHEWWSLRARNRYVLAPGSTHPETGKLYAVKWNNPIADCPDWVAKWCAAHSQDERTVAGSLQPVSENFDFDRFTEWLPFSLTQDGNWYVANFCPGTGARHAHSTRTGIYWDGAGLGWKCFAQNCPCAYHPDGTKFSIGDLVSALSQQMKPYDGIIWVAEPLMEREYVNILTAPKQEIKDDIVPGGSQVAAGPQSGLKPGEHILYERETEAITTFNGATTPLKKLRWLWPEKIPLNKISLLVGKPGCCKSMASTDIMARVTKGIDWPDSSKNTLPPSRVLLLAAEDDVSSVIMPRLIAAGADMSRVEVLNSVIQTREVEGDLKQVRGEFTFSEDLSKLRKALLDHPDIALVVVDPITAYWGSVDANKDKEVRPVMNLLDTICEQTGVTFMAVCHLNKRADTDAMGKILGASSLPGAARALWGFYRDPDKEKKGEYYMSQIKVNSAKRSEGLKYCIAEEPIEIEGSVEYIPRTEWLGVSELTADDVSDLAKAKSKEQEDGVEGGSKLDEAKEFVQEQLARGARLMREVHQAREQQSISEKTFRRAYKLLGVRMEDNPNPGRKGREVWMALPGSEHPFPWEPEN
jgi:hypothetical protein